MMKGKNCRKVKYQCKECTDYKASQFPRGLEQPIRKYLRRQNAAKAASLDDAAAFSARVQAIRRQYKEFSKAAGLPGQLERMQVYMPGAPGAVQASPEGYLRWIRLIWDFRDSTGKFFRFSIAQDLRW